MSLHSQEEIERTSAKANPLRLLLPAAGLSYSHMFSQPQGGLLLITVNDNSEGIVFPLFAFGNQKAPKTAHRLHSTQTEEQGETENVIYPPPSIT